MRGARWAGDPARSWSRWVRSAVGITVVLAVGVALVVARLSGGAAATDIAGDSPGPGTDSTATPVFTEAPPSTAVAPTSPPPIPTTATPPTTVEAPPAPPAPTGPVLPPATWPPPPPTTRPAPPTTIAPIGVAVVGDSLVAQAIDDVLGALLASGRSGNIFGHAGMAMDAPTILGAAEAAAADPAVDVIVLATTSNDNVANARRADQVGAAQALSEYRSRLEDRVARFGDRCVVVVDMREGASELYRSAFAPATNAELSSFAAQHGNVVVVAWSAIARDHGDDWFLADGLHFSDAYGDRPVTIDRPAGRAAYAAAIVDGVDRCP